MEDLLNLMLFYGFFLGITLAIGHLSLKKEKKSGYLYTVSIFTMGLCLLNMALYSTRMIRYYEYYCTALLPVSYFATASQYVRYKILITPGDQHTSHNWSYYLPAIIVFFIILIPALNSDLDYNPNMIRFYPVLNSEFKELQLYYKILLLLYPLLSILHFILFSLSLIDASFIWNRKNSHQNLIVFKSLYVCGLLICLSSCFAFAGCLYSLNLVKAGIFIGTTGMLLTYIFAVRYPKFSIKLHEEVQRYRYMKSKIKGLDVIEIIGKLEHAMKIERAYAVEGITIRDMATELGVTVHQLSEILNNHMGKNFNSYINSYRIEESKKLLLEKPEMSIIVISGDVGFSSSSMFSTIFSKIEGLSPREFRKIKNICKK